MGGLIIIRPIMFIGIQQYDIATIWSPCQGSDVWLHGQGKGFSYETTLSFLWRYQWVTLSALVTTPRQCPLVRPWSKKERKSNKWKIKAIKGLGKSASMTGTTHLLQRHPRTIPTPGLHYDWTSLDHTTSCYMAWIIFFGNFLLLMDTGPIGHSVSFFNFV